MISAEEARTNYGLEKSKKYYDTLIKICNAITKESSKGTSIDYKLEGLKYSKYYAELARLIASDLTAMGFLVSLTLLNGSVMMHIAWAVDDSCLIEEDE